MVDGSYREAFPDPDGRYHSPAVPGFWLRPEWPTRESPPNALACLAEIGPEVVRAALGSAGAPPDRPDEAGGR